MTTWVNTTNGVQSWTAGSANSTTWTRLESGIEVQEFSGYGMGGYGEGPYGEGGVTVITVVVEQDWTPFTLR